MKNLFKNIVVLYLILITSSYAVNPIKSPMFDEILKQTIGDSKYIFDDSIKMKVPNFADNPVQVPIYVNASNIKDAKKLIIFADLNPIPFILKMPTDKLLPVFSTNIKVAQETPLRALVLDSKGIWHIGSININSNGGGCDISSQASGDYEFAKLQGKTKGKFFDKKHQTRIKASIFHPMETGLIFGTDEFYINKIEFKDEKSNTTVEIETTSAISENPRFIFETKDKSMASKIMFFDTDANEYELKLQ